MTRRLYDEDSSIRAFEARVRSCVREEDGWAAVLDATAFFPGGGGQAADGGTLGGVPVLSVYEKDGEVVHVLPQPVPTGNIRGEVDWPVRFRRMQGHSGEHIVSGLVHNLYGWDNVGFHMGAEGITVDFSGYLSREELDRVECLANAAVTADVPVTAGYPSEVELAAMTYRSKREIEGPVRIVTIQGIDRCACCAPHVARTGEIGLIKITDSIRHREGVRITLLCGGAALDDYRMRFRESSRAAALLSAKPEELGGAVARARSDVERLTHETITLKRRMADYAAASLPEREGNLCFFSEDFDTEQLRTVVNAGMTRCSGVCAAFSGADGAYGYIIGSRSVDLRAAARTINQALDGRGGGRPEMIQGSAAAGRARIEAFFAGFDGAQK